MIGCQILLLSRIAYGTFEVYLGCKYNFFFANNNEIKEVFQVFADAQRVGGEEGALCCYLCPHTSNIRSVTM